jgi:hypothetical protein
LWYMDLRDFLDGNFEIWISNLWDIPKI